MSARAFFMDRGIGETRGVVTLGGRPERLLIAREGDAAETVLGARCIARARKVDRAMGAAFVELPGKREAVLPLKPDMERFAEGAALEVEVRSEPRADKAAVARLIGPGEGAPRLLQPGPDIEAELRALAKGGDIIEGAPAREAADEAEEEALALVHALPGGGTIAIEETRALVAVDVDLGERGGAESKRAARAANLAALAEGARLLRLKGLGGLVVFDLVGRGHDGAALIGAARLAFGPDNPGVAIGAVSRFGTLELTVPRRRRPAVERLRGAQASALRLVRAIEREGRAAPGARLLARCDAATAGAMGDYAPALAERLGARFEVAPQDGWAAGRIEVAAR